MTNRQCAAQKRTRVTLKRKYLVLTIAQTLCASSAFAATITVNNTTDESVADGSCSLREAIDNANGSQVVTDCATGDTGADTIVFDATLNGGTITLSGSELSITSSIAIEGPGASNLTISGGAGSRIFNIKDDSPSNSVVTIDGLTLADGLVSGFGPGGAIYNIEDLTISNSTLSGNSTGSAGGAIRNSKNLTMIDCTLSDNTSGSSGGAVFNFPGASLNLFNSTLSGNVGVRGGGIFNNGGNIRIDNSTLSGNSSTNGNGGGIYSNGLATISLNNTTLSDNSASRYGGGVYNRGTTFSFSNSIIANSSGDNCLNRAGSLLGSYNLFTDASCLTADSTNQVVADPGLGALADNGGPTLTHALLPDSPAIDMGSQTACDAADLVTDQTGMPRPIDGDNDGTATCDIGAFEFVALSASPVAMDAAFSVLENAADGTAIGQVIASDPDNNIPATGAWQIIAGNNAGAYEISDNGTLRIADSAAIEAATLIVQVTDADLLSDTATITISILADVLFSDGFER